MDRQFKMYTPLTESDIEQRLTLLDKTINQGEKDVVKILKLVDTLFPLGYVMDDDFRGKHALVLTDGKLEICVWCNNESYFVRED